VAPLLQNVQQHAVVRAQVDGAPDQEEQSSSGSAAELDMDVDSDEEDKRLKEDRALQEYKEEADEQGHSRFLFTTRNCFSTLVHLLFDLGPRSKANCMVMLLKKKKKKEQRIANLKLKAKRKL